MINSFCNQIDFDVFHGITKHPNAEGSWLWLDILNSCHTCTILEQFLQATLTKLPHNQQAVYRLEITESSGNPSVEIIFSCKQDKYDNVALGSPTSSRILSPIKNITPAGPSARLPTHPGKILLKTLFEPLNLSTADGQKKMPLLSQKKISNILEGKEGISECTAALLEKGFELPKEFWLLAQKNFFEASERFWQQKQLLENKKLTEKSKKRTSSIRNSKN